MGKKNFKEFVKEHKEEILIGCAVLTAGIVGGLACSNSAARNRLFKKAVDVASVGCEGLIVPTDAQLVSLFGEDRRLVDLGGTTVEVTGAIFFGNAVET